MLFLLILDCQRFSSIIKPCILIFLSHNISSSLWIYFVKFGAKEKESKTIFTNCTVLQLFLFLVIKNWTIASPSIFNRNKINDFNQRMKYEKDLFFALGGLKHLTYDLKQDVTILHYNLQLYSSIVSTIGAQLPCNLRNRVYSSSWAKKQL